MITEHVGVSALTHVHARPGGRGVLRFDQQGWTLHRTAFAWPDLKRLMIWVVVATWVLAVLAMPFRERLEHDDTAQLVAAIIATPMFLILVGLLLYWVVNLLAEVLSIVFTVVTLGHFHRNPPRWLQRLRAARRRKSAPGEPSAPVAAHRYDSVVEGRVLHRFRRTVVLLRTTDGRTLRYRTWGFAGRTRLLGDAFAEHLADRLR
ncbi:MULTISPECIES: hypothetical protein [unclassified Saccharopolyspora]|uniref:hypothetical protein n=1 Tax=unclassified Saccharopolyspora TaxID=2646250 RepID=UPI001CD33FFF|nr:MULTISPECIES: hypothetical protein [unclassified Saccharopolyspora]MCA1186098.1 hypothetical protein [Saccharopolyspora sp. 6T]MCA1193142.1 hypothetical protein [Saccharopolyspora sp. 6V]MCA1224553.1 hypothetical protein [Saccharopolyspora sp. 6M]MCA1279024.1 hypothetical protein [Saccharopolyspora sp. 7B]